MKIRFVFVFVFVFVFAHVLHLYFCKYFMKCVVAGGNEAMPDKINISSTDFLSPQKLDDNDCYFKRMLPDLLIILESENNSHSIWHKFEILLTGWMIMIV